MLNKSAARRTDSNIQPDNWYPTSLYAMQRTAEAEAGSLLLVDTDRIVLQTPRLAWDA